MASPQRLPVLDAELSRLALVLAQRFVQRWDLYAHHIDDGSYVSVHGQVNVGYLLDHPRGEITSIDGVARGGHRRSFRKDQGQRDVAGVCQLTNQFIGGRPTIAGTLEIFVIRSGG
jgi:hypothetical protein